MKSDLGKWAFSPYGQLGAIKGNEGFRQRGQAGSVASQRRKYALQRQRVLVAIREGKEYPEIAASEKVSVARIAQIMAGVRASRKAQMVALSALD